MPEGKGVEAELRQANERFYRAFESLDLGRMEEVWLTDAAVTCIHPGWTLRAGWPEVRESWALIFGNTEMIRFAVTDVETFVRGTCGWAICLENILSATGGVALESRVLATNIFERREGRWALVHHHGSPVVTAAPPVRRPRVH
ncbi:MAG: nuclear transport factor 2 family protein [Deltaproteobacteria bacterium]|nr:nuclear transport factor 2 family protein [Deltaproteobacteria bacterium]